jgi:methylmalonyl-CoA/ethylmalonyl-CoA epimerase
MMNCKELLEYNSNRQICQICLVTPNIEETLKDWVEILKVGPWKVITLSDETITDAMLDGKKIDKPFKYYCAVSMFGNIQVEIVQPCYGFTIYDEFLAKTGGGLHHFKEKISDAALGEILREYAQAGIKATFSGRFREDAFVNLDTQKKLYFTFELGNFADISLPEEIYYTYPSE